MDLDNTGVVIPALNAEKSIISIIEELFTLGFSKEHIIVIDDGSEDSTYAMCAKIGVYSARHEKNMGKGAALKHGLRIACEKKLKDVITLDADAQHRVQDIRKFMRAWNGYDLIVGQRVDPATMPGIRQMVNRIVSMVISILADTYIRDVQCGFRYIRLKILDRMALISNRYEIDSEIIYRALRRGCRVGFVPVTTIYQEEKSYIRPFIDTIRFIKLAVTLLWR